MKCPYCGGWHYGYGEPPAINYAPTPLPAEEARNVLADALYEVAENACQRDPYDNDVLPEGDGKLWEARVYGTDEQGREVTVAFGIEGTTREDHVLISDGHIEGWQFYSQDESGVKNHDHVGPGPGPDAVRGRYSGWDDFHDPEG